MNKNKWWLLVVLVFLAFLVPIAYGYLHTHNIAVLNPKGQVAFKQRQLMLTTMWLGLLVVVPVYAMLAGFAWRYREGNHHAKYSPNLAGNWLAETVWWAIPLTVIGILSVITWHSSHSLDPRRPLNSAARPLIIQVVALQWKWLFIYPEQNIASVNYAFLPVGRPVSFELTADAPMNSFWIPQLGSQIYAMPGMSTRLNLLADKAGTYGGSSANLSGSGFADMRFTAQAGSASQFGQWLTAARHSPKTLDLPAYNQLARPSRHNPAVTYSAVDKNLYHKILLKYMGPGN